MRGLEFLEELDEEDRYAEMEEASMEEEWDGVRSDEL